MTCVGSARGRGQEKSRKGNNREIRATTLLTANNTDNKKLQAMHLQTPCPDRKQLLALSRGEVSGDALDAICEHLSSCPSCESALAAMDESDDGVVRNLRRFLHREPAFDREQCLRLEANAKAIGPGRADGVVATTPDQGDGVAPAGAPQQPPLSKLGKYQLLKELGRGGMGIVYLGVHTNLNRKVAVKVIRAEYSDDPHILARFRREMKAIGELVHPNIVAATDADEADGKHFLVMEYVDGLDLDAVVKATGPLPIAEACEIARQAALGLQFVHEHQRVHRDLKPSNLMLSADGVVKILDLGLVRLFADHKVSEEISRSNVVMGTADYIAPEQWQDSHSVDIRADIYSLGCTLHKLLIGEAPFSGSEYKRLEKKKHAHLHLPIVPIQSRRADIPADLAAVVIKMLRKDPEDRYATPRDAAEALAPFAGGANCRVLAAEALERSVVLKVVQGVPAGQTAATVEGKGKTPGPGGIHSYRLPGLLLFRRKWKLSVLAATILFAATSLVTVQVFSRHLRPEKEQRSTALPVDPKGDAAESADFTIKKPGIWHKLLVKEPVPLYWNNATFKHDLKLTKELEQLTVYAPFVALLSLGKTEQAGYEFLIRMRQVPWTGGCGIFFGAQDEIYKDKPRVRCQYLEVRQSPTEKGHFTLARFWATLARDGDTLLAPSTRFSGPGEDIGFIGNDEELVLQINVKWELGLHEVHCRGKPLRSLISGPLQPPFKDTEQDFIGSFGTFSRQSNCVFRKAEILLYERRKK